jgi:tRNA threonylcarbamoyladenosine biosynthesis protein TsaB
MATTILALDCSTTACSAACWRDGKVLSRRFVAAGRGQAEMIMPMIEEVMAEAGLAFAGLGLLAVTVGPGAFTGLRIGLAAAKGMALAAGLPIAGISTTLAVAAAVPAAERRGRTILAAVESKRTEIYAQAFDAGLNPLGEIVAQPAAELALLHPGPIVLAGERSGELAPLMASATLASSLPQPDAAAVAALASRLWPGRSLPAAPLYLRPPDVTMAK